MTTPTTNKTATPAKSTPAKTDNKSEKVEDKTITTSPDPVDTPDTKNVEPVKDDAPVIPEALASNPILADFCEQYLKFVAEITDYNKVVLAKNDSEWNSTKLLEKSREMANPTDANKKPVEAIKAAREAFEKATQAQLEARRKVVELTAKELGVTFASTAERDPEKENALKESRKTGIVIGEQLEKISGLTSDASIKTVVEEFLKKNPMPAVGRDQVRTFGDEGKTTTPKFRVTVEITKGDEVLLKEDGFTRTALALTQKKFGYEYGKAPKSEKLREAWMAAGNTTENTVQNPVEFEDNGLHYKISKK